MIYWLRHSIYFLLPLSLAACSETQNAPPPGGNPPPAGQNETFSNLVADETFQAASAVVGTNGGLPGSVIANNADNAGLDGNTTIRYIAASNAFELTINQSSFDVTQLFDDIDTTNPITGQTRYAEGNNFLILENAGEANRLNNALVFDYVSYGTWAIENNSSFAQTTGWFVTGIQTDAADMPTMGTATFNGVTEGRMYLSGDAYVVMGDASLTANFTTGLINADFDNMTRQRIQASGVLGTVSVWRDFTGTANITNGTSIFTGTTRDGTGAFTGTLEGGFFGPAGQAPTEAGGTWTLIGGGETAIGAFIVQD